MITTKDLIFENEVANGCDCMFADIRAKGVSSRKGALTQDGAATLLFDAAIRNGKVIYSDYRHRVGFLVIDLDQPIEDCNITEEFVSVFLNNWHNTKFGEKDIKTANYIAQEMISTWGTSK